MGNVMKVCAASLVLTAGAVATVGDLAAQSRATGPSLADVPDVASAIAAAGLEERAVLNSILGTLQHGVPQFHFVVDRFRADEAARVALIRGLGPQLGNVVESHAFATAYGYLRRDAEQAAVGEPPRDPSMARADAIHELSLRTIDLRRELTRPGLTTARRAELDRELATARDALTAAQRAANDPGTVAAEQRAYTEASQAYEARRIEAQAQLEATVPIDPRQLVADRLDAFVRGCRDVNFRAHTSTVGGVTRFDDAALEARPKLWKLCFRAGQRSTQEARRVATGWLGRLARAGVRPRTPS